MSLRLRLLSLMLVIMSGGGVDGNASGAPPSACTHMLPNHGQLGQTGPFPGSILVNASAFRPGDIISLTVVGQVFKGILVQARFANSLVRVGEWVDVTFSGAYHLVECGAAAGGGHGVTHDNSLAKNGAVFRWRAPSLPAGTQVQFLVTIVVEYSTFWVQEKSPPLTSLGAPSAASTAAPAPTSPPVSGALGFVDLRGCGTGGKSCFYYSPTRAHCADSCEYKVSLSMHRPIAEYIQIDMVGKRSGWLGIGFSDDRHMGDDEVYACVDPAAAGPAPELRRYWTPGGHAAPRPEPSLAGAVMYTVRPAGYVDGYVQCSFIRPVNPGNGTIYPHSRDLAGAPTHIVFTHGPVDGSGNLQRHLPERPATTWQRVYLDHVPVSRNLNSKYVGNSANTHTPAAALLRSNVSGAAVMAILTMIVRSFT